jgi:hypothetical protein
MRTDNPCYFRRPKGGSCGGINLTHKRPRLGMLESVATSEVEKRELLAVPCDLLVFRSSPKDSLRLYEAAGEPKELWLLEGARR